MKKILIGLIVAIALCWALIFTSIAFTNFEKLYQDFLQNSTADIQSVSSKEFKVNKFPIPSIIIAEIDQPNKINLKKVEISFSLFSLLTFSPKISSVNIEEAKLYFNNDNVHFTNHDEFISELIAKNALSIKAKINKAIFVESDNDHIVKIENFVFDAGQSKTNFSGKLDLLGNVSGHFAKSKDDIEFKLLLKDNAYSIDLLENYKNSILQDGKVIIKTINLADKIRNISPDISNFVKNLESDEEVSVEFAIKPEINKLGLKDVRIMSDSIEGAGEINLSKLQSEPSEIKLSFNKIDLVSWQQNQNDKNKDISVKYISNSNFKFDRNKLDIDLFFKKVRLDSNNSLSEVTTKCSTKDGELVVEDFKGMIDDAGHFKITGTVSQNSFRNLFNGHIYLNHNDLNNVVDVLGDKTIRTDSKIPFILISDLKLSSVDISLQNLLIKTDIADIIGSFSTKFIGNSTRVNSNLRFTAIDADNGNLPYVKKAINYVESLFEGMKEDSYPNKFIPIRVTKSIGSHNLTFDSFKFRDKIYNNITFNLGIEPGRVAVEQLYIQDEESWIDTSINLTAQAIKPTITVIIHNGSLKVNFLSPRGLIDLRNKLLQDYDLSKINLYMSFAIRRLYRDNLELGRVRMVAFNKNNLFDISKLDLDLLGGRMESSGSVLLDPYTYNFVYSLNSAKLAQVAEMLPSNYLQSNGVFSANGMWSTNGNSPDEQLYNLYTNSNVIAKGITVNDFSIDNLVETMTPINYNYVNLESDIKNALLTGKTLFNEIKTGVSISKGIVKLTNLILKSKNTSASASASIDLYKFDIDADSIFSFYLPKAQYGRRVGNYTPTNLNISVTGSILSPKKEANTQELEEFMKKRVIK